MTTSEDKKVNYEGHWDEYAQNWRNLHPDKIYIGDEWTGVAAGAAQSLDEYTLLIEEKFIVPYIKKQHQVLEIGIGGSIDEFAGAAVDDRYSPPIKLSGTIEAIEQGDVHAETEMQQ